MCAILSSGSALAAKERENTDDAISPFTAVVPTKECVNERLALIPSLENIVLGCDKEESGERSPEKKTNTDVNSVSREKDNVSRNKHHHNQYTMHNSSKLNRYK